MYHDSRKCHHLLLTLQQRILQLFLPLLLCIIHDFARNTNLRDLGILFSLVQLYRVAVVEFLPLRMLAPLLHEAVRELLHQDDCSIAVLTSLPIVFQRLLCPVDDEISCEILVLSIFTLLLPAHSLAHGLLECNIKYQVYQTTIHKTTKNEKSLP